MSKLDELMMQFDAAAARAPKRKPRRTKSGDMTPEAQAVIIRAAELAQADAREALAAEEREVERTYYRRVARLAHLGQRFKALKARLETVEWGSVECARLLAYGVALQNARAAIFALPVMPSDLADGGRFYRRAKWLGLEVGMEAVDEIDVVAGAVELCYIKGQTATAVHYVRRDGRLRREEVEMPTLGAMYRNLKAFYNGQVDRFRRNKSAGVVAVHSLEALQENMGDAWLDENAATLQFLGFGYASQADLDALYPAVMVAPDMLPASRAATIGEANRKRAVARLKGLEAAARDTLAEGAKPPAGYDAASFNADRLAVRVLINGGTLADVAKHANVSEATLAGRLLALEGALGATVYSTAGSEPVRGSESRGMAHQARAEHDAPALPRYKAEGWSSKRNACRASAVVVTKREAVKA